MTIQLNHTIVAARDKDISATFLTEILGLPAPILVGPFAVVTVCDTSLDYMNVEEYRTSANGEITSQHFAFLVSEAEFDEIFERIPPATPAVLGRPRPPRARPDQHLGRWARGLLCRPEWPSIGDHHPYLRQRGTTASRVHPLFAATGDDQGERSDNQEKHGDSLAAAERTDVGRVEK